MKNTNGYWKIVLTYRYINQKKDDIETFFVDEPYEVGELIENGPDFRSLLSAVITKNMDYVYPINAKDKPSEEKFKKMTEEELLSALNNFNNT